MKYPFLKKSITQTCRWFRNSHLRFESHCAHITVRGGSQAADRCSSLLVSWHAQCKTTWTSSKLLIFICFFGDFVLLVSTSHFGCVLLCIVYHCVKSDIKVMHFSLMIFKKTVEFCPLDLPKLYTVLHSDARWNSQDRRADVMSCRPAVHSRHACWWISN